MTDTFITVGDAAAGVVENVRPARPGVGIATREPSQIVPAGEANGPFGKTSPWKKRIDGTVVRRGGE